MGQGKVDSLISKFSPRVKVKNKEALEEKLNRMSSQEPSRFLVISDFDYTFSKFKDSNGDICWSTHAVFDNNAHKVDQRLGTELENLRAKYFPIEFDHRLTIEEKIPHMETWWKTAHSRIVQSGFSKSILESFVTDKDCKVYLRDGCEEMLKKLEESSVPLVLFSAGLGDLIQIFLKDKLNYLPSNIHLISNMMEFDAEGKVAGFKDPLIHTFNKNSGVIRKEKHFFDTIRDRSNVLLLGDSLGDIHMDVGVQNEQDIIKVGFLNQDVERLLPKYEEGYDIVIVQDPTMEVPLDLIDSVLDETPSEKM